MNGCIEGKVKEYLENLAAYCNRYDAFAIRKSGWRMFIQVCR